MIRFILFLWQLPQSIVALVLWLVVRKRVIKNSEHFFCIKGKWTGVCLGHFIFISENASENTVRHESGHSIQSLWLGPFYLLVVGLPSITRNLWDRVMHKNWTSDRRQQWYYGEFPENWADKLGKVNRFYE